jgi:hypothetical protein
MIFSTRPRETLPLARPLTRSSKEWSTFVGMAGGELPLLWSSAAICVPPLRAELRSLAEADYAITVTSGNEFPMNFEAASFVFFAVFVILQLFARWVLNSQRTWLARQSGPNKLHRAGPMGLAYGGAIILTWRYYQSLMYIRPMSLRYST